MGKSNLGTRLWERTVCVVASAALAVGMVPAASWADEAERQSAENPADAVLAAEQPALTSEELGQGDWAVAEAVAEDAAGDTESDAPAEPASGGEAANELASAQPTTPESEQSNILAVPNATGTIASGTVTSYGSSVQWDITDGVLTIEPITGNDTGVLGRNYSLSSTWPWASYASSVTSVIVGSGVHAGSSLTYVFRGLSQAESITFPSDFLTGQTASMSSMFEGCSSLASLDVSQWDVSSVASMSYMFHGCSSLASLDVSKWDTSSATDMVWMFYGCSSLKTLAVSGWDVSKCSSTQAILFGCSALDAAGTSVAEGSGSIVTNGNSYQWSIADGVLTIKPLDGHDEGVIELATALRTPWHKNTAVTSVVVEKGMKGGSDLADVFSDMTSVTSISFPEGFVGDATTTLAGMFSGCSSLETLDVSGWDVSSATDMSSMFSGCSRLTSLDVSSWNTSAVTNVSSMFSGCSRLASLDVSFWDTSAVTDASSMFYGCSRLESLDVSGWKTANVTGMSSMFYNCSKLASLDVSGWNTANVGGVGSMFYGCSSLVSLDTSGWSTTGITSFESIFEGCTSLKTVGVTKWDTSNVDSMRSMFSGCSSLELVDLSGWNVASVGRSTSSTYGSFYQMFYGCRKLVSVGDLSGWSAPFATSTASMFSGCSSLQSLDASGWDVSSVTSASSMFNGCSSLRSLDMSGSDLSSATNLSYMLQGCSSLESLVTTGWDISAAKSMSFMLYGCSSLASIDTSDWDVSAVTNMSGVFCGCSAIESLDLSKWDVSSVTSFSQTFNGCSSLKSLSVADWNVAKVSTMYEMFSGCSSLQTLDVSGWNTSGVTNMYSMFYGCSSLRSLDLSGWIISDRASMSGMFTDCSSLSTIVLGSGWRFNGSSSLQSPVGIEFSGSWICYGEDGSVLYGPYSPSELSTAWASAAMPGTWTWQVASIPPVETPVPNSLTYSGSEQTGVVETDLYTVSGGSATDAGTYTATLTLRDKDHYIWADTGSVDDIQVEWSISPAYLSAAKVTLSDTSFAYTGEAIEPGVTVAMGDLALVAGTDYEARYYGNVSVGSAAVVVTGVGNYQGTASATFEITAVEPEPEPEPEPDPEPETPSFTDVKAGEWYATAVAWADGCGLMTGYSDGSGKFGVGDTLTRGQLAVVLWRYAEPEEAAVYDADAAVDATGKADAASGQYYTGAVNWAVSSGVINGYTDGTNRFGVEDSVTFEQLVTILVNYQVYVGNVSREAVDASSASALAGFTDASSVDGWAQASLSWGYANGMFNGYDRGSYKEILPLEGVARERAATVLYNLSASGMLPV